jgi:hypothetical protein
MFRLTFALPSIFLVFCQIHQIARIPQIPSFVSGTSVALTVTVVPAAVSGSTYLKTFTGTSLSQFATLSTLTSLTNTEVAGIVLEGVVLAGGLAWLAVPPPPGAPPLETPTVPPMPEPTAEARTETPTSTSSTRSFESVSVLKMQLPSNYPINLFGPVPTIPDEVLHCGFPSDDPTAISPAVVAVEVGTFCEQMQNQSGKAGAPLQNQTFFGSDAMLTITVSLDAACSSNDQVLDSDDCHYFLNQTVVECDPNSAAKNGGTVQNACLDYILDA